METLGHLYSMRLDHKRQPSKRLRYPTKPLLRLCLKIFTVCVAYYLPTYKTKVKIKIIGGRGWSSGSSERLGEGKVLLKLL